MTRIIHITDLHFWRLVWNPALLCNKRLLGNLNLALRRRHYVRQERAESFLALYRSLDADAVLIGGDMTTTGTNAEYKLAAAFVNELAQVGPPVFMVAGNHDLYTFEAQRKHRFESYFGDRLQEPEKPQLTYMPGDIPLLLVPTAKPNLLSSRGAITGAQLVATRRLLEERAPDRLLVLAHYPILDNPAVYNNGVLRRLGNAEALRRVLGVSGCPTLYLAGHVHRFSHARDPRFQNLTQLTTRALFYEKDDCPGGFTEILFDKDACTVYPWRYCDGWERASEPSAC